MKAEISKRETFINILINSKSVKRGIRQYTVDDLDHGVSLGATDINACDQTPEGLSAQMFENESFETWSVVSYQATSSFS